MLLMVIAAMLAAERAPGLIIADVIALQASATNPVPLQIAYRKCLADKTVELGAGNSESADTLLRGVAAVCLPVETALRAVYAKTPIGPAWTDRLMRLDRTQGEDDGVARRLAVRAARQPR